jgi:HEAT repeats
MRKILLTCTLFLLLGLSPLTQQAQAWGRISIGIGLPLYVGPGPYYYGYPYRYYYPPTYVVPAPAVVYQAAPPPTVVASPAPSQGESVPAPAPQTNAAPVPVVQGPAPLPRVTNVIPLSNQSSPEIDALVRQLSQTNDTARRDAAIQLGRLKATSAVDALTNMLAKDASPIAREAAARGLGLIASPTSLKALIFAAQADDDREVRRSAQFAVEVIRSNLRGN